METASKRDELEALRNRMNELETEVERETIVPSEVVSRDYPFYHITVGAMLGIVGAMASLLFNVIGSVIAGKPPLELIRIYLTFPLGERALEISQGNGGGYAVSDGLILALGCCLYIGTGMLLGIPIAMTLSRAAARTNIFNRLVVATLLSLAIWGINFYGVLAWLQPLLFKGSWIVDGSLLPWWVAAATHVVFGWTIAILYPFFRPTPANQPA